MFACQQEPCCVVIKCGWSPSGRRMARLTLVTQVARHVIGIRRVLVVRLMTLVAVSVGELVIPVGVAHLTLD